MGNAGPAKRAILIAGPTASGKSALALALAEERGGTVINADSMQVYADLRILTARPSDTETARAPHRLFGHVDAAEPYSVGRWLDEARVALDHTVAAGRVPVLVGGTGLYIKALTQGLSAMPAIPAGIRARLRAEAIDTPPETLHARLRAVDPDTASRLRPTDPQRILRALEMFEATGRSLSSFQHRRAPAILPLDTVAGVFLDVPRPELYRRIDQRFDAMMSGGALDEVAALGAHGLDPDLPAMRALGVAPLLAALRGERPMNDAVDAAKALSRHYAKRQMTFARHQLPGLRWSTADDARTMLSKDLRV